MKILAPLLMMSLLAACGSGQQDQAAATPPPPTGTVNVPKSNVFSPLVQDLNKAKQVNNTVQQQAKDANKSLEDDSAPSAATATGP